MLRHWLRDPVGKSLWLSVILALWLHGPAVAQITPSHESLCAFSMRDTQTWQQVPHARDVSLQRIPSSPAPRYYQYGEASMVVYCAPRFGPNLNFEDSVAREVSAISHSYTSFSVDGNDRFEFHQAPGQWFLFSGSLKLKPARLFAMARSKAYRYVARCAEEIVRDLGGLEPPAPEPARRPAYLAAASSLRSTSSMPRRGSDAGVPRS